MHLPLSYRTKRTIGAHLADFIVLKICKKPQAPIPDRPVFKLHGNDTQPDDAPILKQGRQVVARH
jgi:hypothetical protein